MTVDNASSTAVRSRVYPQVTARPYQGLDDFKRVRQFLLETYRLNRTYHNWEIRRWEGQYFWGDETACAAWTAKVRLWETDAGALVGAAHHEGGSLGNAWLQIHPDYRDLEDEMLDWAEAHLAAPTDDGRARLDIEVFDYDTDRQQRLTRRGYVRTDRYGFLRWRSIDEPLPAPSAGLDGYTVRSLRPGDPGEAARWSDVIAVVFRHAQPTAEIIARFQAQSPSYRHDLHLVAEAPDGSFAAFAGLTVEHMNHTAVFEPVGTHPDHRRRGLARAVMSEGLRRLRALDTTRVYVGTGDMIPANGLYAALGFTDYHIGWQWRRVF